MVGEKLELLLKAKGIRPGTLATMTGINKGTIYSIIKRNNKKVDYSIMQTIAEALDVPVEYFHEAEPAQEVPSLHLDDEEARLLRAWRGAEAGVRVLALEMLENHQAGKETENLA